MLLVLVAVGVWRWLAMYFVIVCGGQRLPTLPPTPPAAHTLRAPNPPPTPPPAPVPSCSLHCLCLPAAPPHHLATAEAKLQRQAEAEVASSSEVLQQRVADLEGQIRWAASLCACGVLLWYCVCMCVSCVCVWW